MKRVLRFLTLYFVVACGAAVSGPGPGSADGSGTQTKAPSVFRLPELQSLHQKLEADRELAFRNRDHVAAEAALGKLLELAPWDPIHHYNLGCLRILQGRLEEAWPSLERAVDAGLRNPAILRTDPDLARLHEHPRFADLLRRAERLSGEPPPDWAAPSAAENGLFRVTAANTAWDFRLQMFRVYTRWNDPRGFLYHNHDRGHSVLDLSTFPDWVRVEHPPEAEEVGLGNGLQLRVLFNVPTLGNSSTALTGGPLWRSMARLAYTTPGGAERLALQSASNHLYVYPEHEDHDAERHGDVFPANSPYLVVSQGSSGSDLPFLRAFAATLDAFPAESRAALIRQGALMPALQRIFRRANGPVSEADDPEEAYLTGAAHPSAFPAENLRPETMIRHARSLTTDRLPPLVRLRVTEESRTVPGRDTFSSASERLFDTFGAVARVHRALAYRRRMVIDARESRDPTGRPLRFEWRLLRGDPALVQILPLNPEGSAAEIRIAYHTRRRFDGAGPPIESDRVDIGVFAHNGSEWSCPAFVTTYFPRGERRSYDADGRLLLLDGTGPDEAFGYVDPLVDGRRVWRDEFRYDERGALTGWTRKIGQAVEAFGPDGRLLRQADPPLQGEGTAVRYELVPPGPGERHSRILPQSP